MPTFGELIKFVMDNKTDKCFLNETEHQIAPRLIDGIKDETLFYSLDKEGKITGMILAEKYEDKKVVFVTDNLSMCLKNLKIFSRMAKEKFKGYTLEWYKHGIHKKHNTEKFYKKMV